MKTFLLIFGCAFSVNVHAGFFCKTTCTGVVDVVVDQMLSTNPQIQEKFARQCVGLGGKLVRAQRDLYGTDQVGCWGRDGRPTYCVVEKPVSAEGRALTEITGPNGGISAAGSRSGDSCRINLSYSYCGKITEAKNIKFSKGACQEIE